MKKIISITIALCLVFASVLPVYAEAWTSQQASNVTLNVQNIYQYLRDFLLTYNDGTVSNWTFGDLYWELHRLATWIAPVGSNDGSYETLWSVLMNIAIDTRSYLPSIPSILTYVSNWMNSNNGYLYNIRDALSNPFAVGVNFYPAAQAQTQLFSWTDGQLDSTWVTLGEITAPGQIQPGHAFNWGNGTPLGNLAYMLRLVTYNQMNEYYHRWNADLKHYNDQLSTWDSQGNTLSQVLFTPESAIQGLYRYLAFTQRDVARLAYVFANDEELEARQLAQANQEQIIDDFIDPNGSGSVSTTDFDTMAGASDSVKDNFNTGYSSSNVWDIFNSDHYGWFSQECADSLDTTGSNTRSLKSSSGYDTPLLDSYYEQILSLGGDN